MGEEVKNKAEYFVAFEFDYILHKNWQEECFKHMKRPKDKRIAESFTWEDILAKINLCT